MSHSSKRSAHHKSRRTASARRNRAAVANPTATAERLERRRLLTAVSWVGAGGNSSWTTAANWSTGAVPAAGDDVTINAGAGKTITVALQGSPAANQAINSLSSNSPIQFSSGTLAIASTTTLGGGFTISGGEIDLNAASTVTTLTESAGKIGGTGSLTAGGLFTWSGGTLALSATTANAGIDFHGGGTTTLSGGTLTNPTGQSATLGATGSLNVGLSTGATFNNAGTLNVANGRFINGGGAAPTLNNSGTANINDAAAGSFSVASGITFNNSGTFNVQGGTTTLSAADNGATAGAFGVAGGATLASPQTSRSAPLRASAEPGTFVSPPVR